MAIAWLDRFVRDGESLPDMEGYDGEVEWYSLSKPKGATGV